MAAPPRTLLLDAKLGDAGKRSIHRRLRCLYLGERILNALLCRLHDNASFRSALPRVIHDETVLAGASTSAAISRAV